MKPANGLAHGVPDIDLFSGLSETERAALAARLTLRTLRRSDVLMKQGDEADALYVLVSGRLAVTLEDRRDPISEIGAGQPVGEIAFLTGGHRTATVTAMRDSLVMALSREEFDRLVGEHPGIWGALTATLARRLAATTSRSAATRPVTARPRTLCVIPAGGSRVSADFVRKLGDALSREGRSVVITRDTARDLLGSSETVDTPEITSRLNTLETTHDHVLLVADGTPSPWTEKAIRHADLVLAVAHYEEQDIAPNAIEQFSARFVGPEATRLVLLHPRKRKLSGTSRWVSPRQIAMHHHVALDGCGDVDRLVRFIQGRAVGLVAAGGGALAAAHTGVFKALCEGGITFDIMGGTSAGAALVAALLLDAPPDEIDAKVGEMFVTNRAMRRYTLPRYSLLDHTLFDDELRRLYGTTEIEDLWLPFFAVSTNLSRFAIMCHRTGPLWRAIRASASIPVMLPPVYTNEGEMLVDGCLLDNVPVRVMRELKAGPNVVVSFKPPELDRFDVDYEALPSRAALMRLVLNPLRRDRLPDAPGLVAVLMRALMVNRRDFMRELEDDDLSLTPPIPVGMGFLDWHRHRELFDTAYRWTCDTLAAMESAERPDWIAAAPGLNKRSPS